VKLAILLKKGTKRGNGIAGGAGCCPEENASLTGRGRSKVTYLGRTDAAGDQCRGKKAKGQTEQSWRVEKPTTHRNETSPFKKTLLVTPDIGKKGRDLVNEKKPEDSTLRPRNWWPNFRARKNASGPPRGTRRENLRSKSIPQKRKRGCLAVSKSLGPLTPENARGWNPLLLRERPRGKFSRKFGQGQGLGSTWITQVVAWTGAKKERK